jgi:hypothetical protein
MYQLQQQQQKNNKINQKSQTRTQKNGRKLLSFHKEKLFQKSLSPPKTLSSQHHNHICPKDKPKNKTRRDKRQRDRVCFY